MSLYIRDPVENRAARVTEDNKLLTRSTVVTQEATEAEKGLAYVFGPTAVDRTLTLAVSFSGIFALITNQDPNPLRIQSLTLVTNADGILFYAVRNPVIATLSNNTAGNLVNSNFDSNNQAQMDAWVWDEVGATGIGGISGGEELPAIYSPAYVPIILEELGAVLLGSGDTLALGAVGIATAQELGFALKFFFEGAPL